MAIPERKLDVLEAAGWLFIAAMVAVIAWIGDRTERNLEACQERLESMSEAVQLAPASPAPCGAAGCYQNVTQ